MSEPPPPTRDAAPSSGRSDRPRGPDTVTIDDPLTRAKADPDATGQTFGRFEILDVLGSGGMGSVFEARDTTLDRPVALKLLHPDVDLDAQAKLLREAKALAKISHPHVVRIYEAGTVGERAFIAMELLRGKDLSRWHRPDRGWRRCVEIYVQAARGLAAAHDEGLVHRDFKPSNCILDDEGRVRVVDFGLARTLGPAGEPAGPSDRSVRIPGGGGRAPVTGTLGYMPLEQLWRQPLDAKSDQFSFCVSLFEAIHGRRPFTGAGLDDLIDAMTTGSIDLPTRTSPVPRRLDRLLRRGLDARPERRWPSMNAMIHELELVLRPSGRRARWVVGGLAGSATAAGLVWGLRDRPCELPRPEPGDERSEQLASTLAEIDEALAASVVPRLEHHVERSSRAEQRLCLARDSGERDEASLETWSRCLAELRGSRERLAQLLTEPRLAGVVATEGHELLDPSVCEDEERFTPHQPLPKDTEEAARAHELWLGIDRARALAALGRVDEALPLLDGIVMEAEELGYGPVRAELSLAHGSVLGKLGRLEAAELQLEQAYALSVEHEHPYVELRAANALAYVSGDLQHRHEAGLKWGLVAEALGHQPWVEPGMRIYTRELLGNIAYEQGHYEEALGRYRSAFEERLELDPDDPMLTLTSSNIGLVLHEQGRYDEALPYALDVLDQRERRLGPRHPAIAHAQATVATTLRALGQYAHARERLSRALLVTEHDPESTVGERLLVLVELGQLELDAGDLPRALMAYEQALAEGTETLGPDHPRVATCWLGLGRVLAAHGQLDTAQRHARRGLELIEERLGPRHTNAAEAMVTLGTIEAAAGHRSLARDHLERAIEISSESEGPRLALGRAFFELARIRWAAGEHDAAIELAERARLELADRPTELAEVTRWLHDARATPSQAVGNSPKSDTKPGQSAQ